MMMHLKKQFFVMLLVLLLTGCTTLNSGPQLGEVSADSRWAITTFVNNTETPQAGARAASMTANLLRAKGVVYITTYQPFSNCQFSFCSAPLPIQKLLTWARRNKIRYVMTGAVNEWQYKVGLDGEPVVSVTLQLYDAMSGRVVWSSVGSKVGTGRSGLSNTGQSLIARLVSCLSITP